MCQIHVISHIVWISRKLFSTNGFMCGACDPFKSSGNFDFSSFLLFPVILPHIFCYDNIFFLVRSIKTTTTATQKKKKTETKIMKIYDCEWAWSFVIAPTQIYFYPNTDTRREKKTRQHMCLRPEACVHQKLWRKCCRIGRRRGWKTKNEIIEIKTILNITHGATRTHTNSWYSRRHPYADTL